MLAVACALTISGCAPAELPVTLDTAGGEAWTFEKRIEGSVAPGACDAVMIGSPRGTVTVRPVGDRIFTRVPLVSDENVVRADCYREGERRGGPAEQRWSVRLRDAPKAWTRLVVTDSGVALDAGASEPAPARTAPIVDYEWHARKGNPAPLLGLPLRGKRVLLPVPETDGEYFVTLRVTDGLGRSDESTAMFRVRGGKAEAVDTARTHPAWIDRAVVYGAVPFFFGRGGFEDVTARLDELAALGVTVIWLPPVTASPPDDFGYAVSDHFRLRPTFGGAAELRALIAAAHARRLKVIIDFVPNHLSERHPYFADVAARGAASPYFDFFDRGPEGRVSSYFGWENLKNLNYDDPEVQRLVIEAFAYWVRVFDVDGFRVDVAWGPRRRAPEFWPRWRRALKRIKPDLLLLAEASARDPYYVRNGFDAAYDWTERPGEWAWAEAFENEAARVALLRRALAEPAYADALVFRFLNNNDTGARFITRYGPSLTRVAAAMQLTLPGLPMLYTGDEIGAAFEPYDEGPPIAWADPHGLRDWYGRLLALRHGHPALRSRALRLLEVAPADKVLAYLRPGAAEDDGILVLLNYAPEPVRARLSDAALRGAWKDLLHGGRFVLDPRSSGIPVPAYGVRVLQAGAGTGNSDAR